jgi:integrase
MLGDMADLAMLGVMRLSDVRLLQRKHVNLAVGMLELPSTKSGPRAVRLCKEAVAIVKRALARHRESQYVFPNQQGKPYSRVHISRCWRNAARTCGLANFSFHDLRKVLPTRALNRGASTAVVQMMGGWASARMVERYASVLNPTLDQYLRPPK